jgi:WD40 repeat protein
MMAKRPEDRYQTAADVAEALAAVFKDVPSAIPVVEAPTAPLAIPLGPLIALPSDEKTGALPTTTIWRRKPSWKLLGLGAAGVALTGVLLLAVVGAWFFLHKPRQPTEPPPITEDPPPPGTWERALFDLRERAKNPDADKAALFDDALQFQLKYHGEPDASLKIAAFMRSLPSPLDELQHQTIPEEELYPKWQPAASQLVAVVGSQRFRSWGPIRDVVWDEDNGAPITVGDAGIFFWDGKGRLVDHERGPMKAAAISSSEPAILATQNTAGNIQLWKRGDKGFVTWLSTGDIGASGAIALTPRGNLLAAAYDKRVLLWDLTLTDKNKTLQRATDTGLVTETPVEKIVFSAEGKWLAACQQNGPIKVWERRDDAWKVGLEMPKELAALRVCAFHPKKPLFIATQAEGGPLYRWDLSQQPPKQLPAAPRSVSGCASTGLMFSANGETLAVAAAAGWASRVELWTGLEPEKTPAPIYAVAPPYLGWKTVLAFSKDSQKLVVGFPGGDSDNFPSGVAVGIWEHDGTSWKERPNPGMRTAVRGVVFSPDCRNLFLTGIGQPERALWRLTDKPSELRDFNVFVNHSTATYYGLLFTPKQQFVCYGRHMCWTNWSSTGLKGTTDTSPDRQVQDVAVARSVPLLAAFQRQEGLGPLVLYDLDKPYSQTPTSLPNRGDPLSCIALSPDGQTLVSGCSDGPVRIWQKKDNAWMDHPVQQQPLSRLVFHPDGKQLIGACRDGVIRIWNVENDRLVESAHLPRPHHGIVTQLALSPDGTTLANMDAENRLVVRDLDSKTREVLVNHRFSMAVTSLAFAPDSRHLAVGLANSATYILRLHPTPK